MSATSTCARCHCTVNVPCLVLRARDVLCRVVCCSTVSLFFNACDVTTKIRRKNKRNQLGLSRLANNKFCNLVNSRLRVHQHLPPLLLGPTVVCGGVRRCFLQANLYFPLQIGSDVLKPLRADTMTFLFTLAHFDHALTPQSGVEAPRLLKRSLSRLYYCCCGCCCFG